MNQLVIRRATVDDLAALKNIWVSMRLEPEALEPRLTEFQVVERDREVVGTMGFQTSRTAGRLHGEGYSDFSVADEARKLFWERLQTLAANHGIFRLWTQENSPFWRHRGFQPAGGYDFLLLPDEWKNIEGKWFTLELKNEAVVNAAFEKQFGTFSAEQKQQSARSAARAKKIFNFIAGLIFLIGFAAISVAIWLFLRFKQSGH